MAMKNGVARSWGAQKGFIAEVALGGGFVGRTGCAPGGYAESRLYISEPAQDGAELSPRRHPPCSPGTSLCNVSVSVMSVSILIWFPYQPRQYEAMRLTKCSYYGKDKRKN